MRKFVVCALVVGLAAGCRAEDVETDDTEAEVVPVALTWVTEPPTEVAAGTAITLGWNIDGEPASVNHTNVHACPVAEGVGCLKPPDGGRVDSNIQGLDADPPGDGLPGDYSVSDFVIDVPGEYIVIIHAKVTADTTEDYTIVADPNLMVTGEDTDTP